MILQDRFIKHKEEYRTFIVLSHDDQFHSVSHRRGCTAIIGHHHHQCLTSHLHWWGKARKYISQNPLFCYSSDLESGKEQKSHGKQMGWLHRLIHALPLWCSRLGQWLASSVNLRIKWISQPTTHFSISGWSHQSLMPTLWLQPFWHSSCSSYICVSPNSHITFLFL